LIFPIIFFFAILLIWEFGVIITATPEYILPRPSRVLEEIINNFELLFFNTLVTAFEASMGFLLANTLGFLAGVLFAHSSKLEQGFYPYAIALKTTPIIAIAPLLILWLGSGIESKIASSAIICFFPILVNTVNGLKSADEETLNLLKSYSASKWQIFTKIRLPLAAPYIFSALKISTGLAVVGAIVGEFVGSNQGIGYLILVSSYHLETAKMFAAIFLSAFIGITFFYLITWIEKKVVFWLPNE